MPDRPCEPWQTWPFWMRVHARRILRRQRRERIRQAAMRVDQQRWQEAHRG